jgi:hypothetical protein
VAIRAPNVDSARLAVNSAVEMIRIVAFAWGASGSALPTDEQVLQAVTRWHDAHQDRWSDPAVIAVGQALHSMYPCSRWSALYPDQETELKDAKYLRL